MTESTKTDSTKPKFKYWAIRNWGKFQSRTDKKGNSLEGRPRPRIWDYTDKETDSLYVSLSCIARYLLDGCRRLRGKHGRNLDADHMWVIRQLDVSGTERGQATHAIQTLVRRGFLIPTNERFDIPQAAKDPLVVGVEVPLPYPTSNQEEKTGDENRKTKTKAFDPED